MLLCFAPFAEFIPSSMQDLASYPNSTFFGYLESGIEWHIILFAVLIFVSTMMYAEFGEKRRSLDGTAWSWCQSISVVSNISFC